MNSLLNFCDFPRTRSLTEWFNDFQIATDNDNKYKMKLVVLSVDVNFQQFDQVLGQQVAMKHSTLHMHVIQNISSDTQFCRITSHDSNFKIYNIYTIDWNQEPSGYPSYFYSVSMLVCIYRIFPQIFDNKFRFHLTWIHFGVFY